MTLVVDSISNLFPFVQSGYILSLCYKSFIRGAVTIIKDHKIIMVNLITYDLGPRLLDHINVLVFKCKVEAGRQEAVDMRRMSADRRRCTVVAETAQLGVSHGPQNDSLGTLCTKETVHSTREESMTLRAGE